MKIQNKTYDEERTILIGMIVDKKVLDRLESKWSEVRFRSPWAIWVATWCMQYHNKYKKAPGSHIQSMYETWASEKQNHDKKEIVGQFLDSLSKQYKKLRMESNSDYVIDLAGNYFNKIKLEKLAEDITNEVIAGNIDKAVAKTTNYRKLEMGVGSWIDVFGDEERIKAAFDERHDSLITYTEGLGDFFGDRLERDGFIVFVAPEKRGKSFMLLELAFKGILQRRKVAFFECGDLSEHQIMRRFMARVSKHPIKPCKVRYPVSIKLRPKLPPLIRFKYKTFTKKLSWQVARKHCKLLTDGKSLKDFLRLSCHPNDTLSVEGIRNTLDEWAKDNWVPDIVVIDYADILNMTYHGLEGRDRINHCWKQLRRLSQELHCLLLTATQSNADAYDAKIMGQNNFSEDKRKNAHVTGMVGINQTAKEKEAGYLRLNWIDLREGFYSPRRCCYVATCLELANMAVRSKF